MNLRVFLAGLALLPVLTLAQTNPAPVPPTPAPVPEPASAPAPAPAPATTRAVKLSPAVLPTPATATTATSALSAASAPAAPGQEFTRYQVIIDRSPFGPMAEAAGAGAGPAPFLAKYQFVALVCSNIPSLPLQAIIIDKEANRTLFKSEGDMLDDAKITKIEQTPAKVTVQHGLEVGALTFAERPNTPGQQPPQPGGPIPMPMPGIAQPPQPGAPPNIPGLRRIPFRRGT